MTLAVIAERRYWTTLQLSLQRTTQVHCTLVGIYQGRYAIWGMAVLCFVPYEWSIWPHVPLRLFALWDHGLLSNCYLYCNFIQNFIFICRQTRGKCLAGYNVNYRTLLINLYLSIKNAFVYHFLSVTFHFSLCPSSFLQAYPKTGLLKAAHQDFIMQYFHVIAILQNQSHPKACFFSFVCFLVWCAQKQHMKPIGPLATHSMLLLNGRIKREE